MEGILVGGMARENVELVRRYFSAANARDFEALRGLVDPEFEFAPHITGGHEGVEFHGVEGMSRFDRVQAETWEGMRVEPREIGQRGDLVAVLGMIRARGRGSGIEVEEPTLWLCRCRAGRLTRLEAHPARDSAQLDRLLGEIGLPRDDFTDYGQLGSAARLSE
jgi:ketosteroid isomerase-like protein